jgi:hypothetical protein
MRKTFPLTPATVAERNSTAYQSGRLLYLQKRVVELRAAGVTYKRLKAIFKVSTATLCKWVRSAQRLSNQSRPRFLKQKKADRFRNWPRNHNGANTRGNESFLCRSSIDCSGARQVVD